MADFGEELQEFANTYLSELANDDVFWDFVEKVWNEEHPETPLPEVFETEEETAIQERYYALSTELIVNIFGRAIVLARHFPKEDK
jgi:acyl carrier protein phosphodiesterase